jgi:hypothetical protein
LFRRYFPIRYRTLLCGLCCAPKQHSNDVLRHFWQEREIPQPPTSYSPQSPTHKDDSELDFLTSPTSRSVNSCATCATCSMLRDTLAPCETTFLYHFKISIWRSWQKGLSSCWGIGKQLQKPLLSAAREPDLNPSPPKYEVGKVLLFSVPSRQCLGSMTARRIGAMRIGRTENTASCPTVDACVNLWRSRMVEGM